MSYYNILQCFSWSGCFLFSSWRHTVLIRKSLHFSQLRAQWFFSNNFNSLNTYKNGIWFTEKISNTLYIKPIYRKYYDIIHLKIEYLLNHTFCFRSMICLQPRNVAVPWFSYLKHGAVIMNRTVVSMCLRCTHSIICFIVAQETGTWHTYSFALNCLKVR